MKKVLFLLFAAALTACGKDNANQTKVVTGDPCEVILTVASPSESRGMTGGAVDGTDFENEVTLLEFYVFDSTGAPDVEVGRTDASTPGKGYKVISTDENKKTHKIIMAGGTDKKIVAVINMGLGEPTTPNDYATLKAKLAEWVYTTSGTGHNARTEERTLGFEMTGEKVFTIAAGSVNNNITIDVARLSSRVNAPTLKSTDPGFVDLADDEIEAIWGTNAATVKTKALTYKHGGWVLVNGRAKSDAFFIGNDSGNDLKTKTITVDGKDYVVPDWDKWKGSPAKAPLNSVFNPSGFYTNTYSGKGAAADWFLDGATAGEHRVYVFENKPETATVAGLTGYTAASTYAVIVKGTIIVDGDEANALNRERYWRINLTRDDDYHVYRNTNYAITVNKLNTPGYNTPEEAEKSDPIVPPKEQTALDVTISVNPWRLNEYTTPM